MFGLGTIINTGGILLGGILGLLFGKLLKDRHQETLTRVCGVSVLFIGVAGALEEMMRRFHIANIGRVAARDIEYKGVLFKEGDCILTPTSAAGIDERRYPDPFTVDFKRGDKKTLVFGRGPHQCIGSFLARKTTNRKLFAKSKGPKTTQTKDQSEKENP